MEKREHPVHKDIQEKVVILEVKVLKAMLVFLVTKEDQENLEREEYLVQEVLLV